MTKKKKKNQELADASTVAAQWISNPFSRKHPQVSATASSAAGPGSSPQPPLAARPGGFREASPALPGVRLRSPAGSGRDGDNADGGGRAAPVHRPRCQDPVPAAGSSRGEVQALSHLEEFFTYLKATV